MSENILKVTNDNFEQEVLNASKPVFIDFWADWCNPCKMMLPTVDNLAENANDRYIVGKLNVDEQGDIASKFRIMSIPTFMLFKNGEAVEKIVGVQTEQALVDIIEKHL